MAFATGLDAAAIRWQLALDAALVALDAAGRALPAAERAHRLRSLAHERTETAHALEAAARASGARIHPWLASSPVHASQLGLPAGTRACVFDLDGVLTNSGALHAAAWADVFDDFLLRLAQRTERQFIPFDPVDDYRAYLDGRPRLDGIHTFLAARGVRVPEGRPDDPTDAETAHGLARRKHEALERVVHRRGVEPVEGARRFLEASARAGIARAVLSESASTHELVHLAGLDPVVDVEVDGGRAQADGLRARPAPDLVLSACRLLEAAPGATVAFAHSAAAVAAAKAAGARVVGVADGEVAAALRGFGADRVVPSLGTLLDRRLAAA